MTLQASGAISLSQVNTELGIASTTTISLNQSNVRTLFGVASGTISMSDGYGKSNRVAASYVINWHAQQLSLTSANISGYVAGKTDVTITVSPGYYVWSADVNTPALTISGFNSGDTVTLANNGYIIGKGGKGGGIDSSWYGQAGGPALSVYFPVTINSWSGYIGGGGGGGSSGEQMIVLCWGGGGGAGGGDGGLTNGTSAGYAQPVIGYGGGIGSAGGNAVIGAAGNDIPGAGGGRIIPGSGGAFWYDGNYIAHADGGQAGGAGGGSSGGASGEAGVNGVWDDLRKYGSTAGGGGGWGASGGYGWLPNGGWAIPGGSGGKAVATNGYSVTWTSGFPSTHVFGAVG